ncbi:MAG: IS21-like element helper ATPase IstB [Deltaproteobacteria bacterium]|nr:IS21-like element helper ATPase IstB [Deltaproteobacteria bacterium]
MNTKQTIGHDRDSMHQNITEYCKVLSLPVVASTYEKEAEAAAKAKISYQEYLYKVLQQQLVVRIDNSINAKIKKARFPFLKTLEEFDFSYQPKIDEKLLRELAELNFLREGKNIVFVGPPGVGKTHLAVALGIKAAKARKRVLFYTAEELINDLISAEVSNRLATLLDSLSRIDLLIVDELGYLELTRASASLFFRFISKRYEKTSTIITSNKPFEEWGEIFNDDVVASAILDRILHHCYPFFIQGKSYRTKELIGNRKK